MPTCEICQKPAAWQKDSKMKKGGHWKKRNGMIVCAAHATNWDRHKNFDLRDRKANLKDVVGVIAAHMRVYSAKGSAKEHSCVGCGKVAKDWCLIPGTKNTMFQMHGGFMREYSLDPNNYIAMCRSCHKTMDNRWRRKKDY